MGFENINFGFSGSQSGSANNIKSIENGTITLNAAGTIATGGVLTNPGANPTIRITTSKMLKLLQIQGYAAISASFSYSYGQDDGTIKFCSGKGIDNNVDGSNPTFSVGLGDPITGNGWSGLVTAIGSTFFDITFTQANVGLDLVAKYHAITG